MTEWQRFVKHQHRLQGVEMPGPKLICIDLQPYQTTQAPERRDILSIGGFSDAVFEAISTFLTSDASRFVAEIEAVLLLVAQPHHVELPDTVALRAVDQPVTIRRGLRISSNCRLRAGR